MRRYLIGAVVCALLAVPVDSLADQGGVRRPCRAAPVVGSPYDDIILGTEGRDFIRGGKGNDLIIGLGGNDRLCGNDGKDKLLGGGGVDQGWGGLGTDTCEAEQGHACRLEG
jgi:Ca2+-binding RTX toxin-like protein